MATSFVGQLTQQFESLAMERALEKRMTETDRIRIFDIDTGHSWHVYTKSKTLKDEVLKDYCKKNQLVDPQFFGLGFTIDDVQTTNRYSNQLLIGHQLYACPYFTKNVKRSLDKVDKKDDFKDDAFFAYYNLIVDLAIRSNNGHVVLGCWAAHYDNELVCPPYLDHFKTALRYSNPAMVAFTLLGLNFYESWQPFPEITLEEALAQLTWPRADQQQNEFRLEIEKMLQDFATLCYSGVGTDFKPDPASNLSLNYAQRDDDYDDCDECESTCSCSSDSDSDTEDDADEDYVSTAQEKKLREFLSNVVKTSTAKYRGWNPEVLNEECETLNEELGQGRGQL